MPGTPLPERKSRQALKRHYDEISGRHLRELFAGDPGRGERLTAEAAGLYLDYSKNRVTDETMRLLVALAEESGVAERRDAMFRGEHINVSEDRAVLHVALRMPADQRLVVDGVDVVQQVHEVLGRMAESATRVSTSCTCCTTSTPSTTSRWSAGIRSATCSTARSSDTLMCSPRNMASRRSATPDSSASATSSRIVSSVTRFLE